MRACITTAILAVAAIFILTLIDFKRSATPTPRKDSQGTIITLPSSVPTKIESQEHSQEKGHNVPNRSGIANTPEKRYYQEALRVKIKAIYFKTKAELLKDQVSHLSSTRIMLNFAKEETGKHKDSNEYKEAIKAGAALEAKKSQLWESLLKQKHFEELLFLAHHRPVAFARQHISRKGNPDFSHLLRRRLLQQEAQQGAAANP